MSKTNYNAPWRSGRADVDTTHHPAFHTEHDKTVGRNYDKIANDPNIGAEAQEGLEAEFPRDDPKCKASDCAARYLAALVPREWGVNVTAIANAIVGEALGPALINVYGDTDPLHSNTPMKASLQIYQDWICPFAQTGKEGTVFKVGQPERNDANQTVGIIVTGKVELEGFVPNE